MAEWSAYRRVLPFLRPYAGPLVLVLAISLLSTALGLAQPYVSKLMIDNALLARDMTMLVKIAGLMVTLTVLGFAVNILASYRYIAISARMLFDIRVALLRHLQMLSPRFYGSFRMGDLMSRINGDVGEVQRVAADSLLSVLSNVLFFAGSVGMMLWLDWRLFLVSIALVPVSLLAFALFQKKLTHLTRETRERGADLGSFLVDTVMGMRVVTALRASEHEVARFRERNEAFTGAMLRMQLASFMAGALPGAIMTAATSAVILYGGYRIIEGQTSIGTLVAFMAYHARLLAPIQVLMGLSSSLATARVSLGRIFALFDTAPEVIERPDARPLEKARGDIRFEHVALRHDREAVLVDAHFSIPSGSFCAVLGESGAGKSTLADLMVRQLDPDAGRILLDGQDLRELRLGDLRREVLLVDQTPWLFNDSIAANIAFAMPEADRDAIEAAGRAAGLESFIARLPEGYETRTGERGLALSAGERQRIALARALLRRPSVLILDEPTSALDAQTEHIIATQLRLAMPNATLIVITHKPALAALADSIIMVEGGHARMRTREAMIHG